MNEIFEISEYDQGNTMIIDALKQTSEIITVLTKKIELLEEDNTTLLNNFDVLYEEMNKIKGNETEWNKNIKKIQRNNQNNEVNNNISKAEKIEKIFNYLNEEKKKLSNQNVSKELDKEPSNMTIDIDTEKKNKILKEIFNYKKKNEEQNLDNEEKQKDNITIEEEDYKKSQNIIRKKRNALFSRF